LSRFHCRAWGDGGAKLRFGEASSRPCLHPLDGGIGGAIRTDAFVPFWSGLLLVSRWLRELTAASPAHADQQLFLNALRPEI
jgi:hypothetical protein